MEATLARPATRTFDVKPVFGNWEELLGLAINGKFRMRIRRNNSRRLYVAERHIFKVGPQSFDEAKRSEEMAGSPHIWPVVASGTMKDKYGANIDWVAQPVLPLTRAVHTYSWDEWRRAFDTILGVAECFELTDLLLYRDMDGTPAPHNWTIYRDTPVIYDYAI